MELIEFLIFLSLNIILLVITLIRKGAIFSIVGLVSCFFITGYALTTGLVLDRFYVTNSTGAIVSTQITYANISILLVVIFITAIMHILGIVRSVSTNE